MTSLQKLAARTEAKRKYFSDTRTTASGPKNESTCGSNSPLWDSESAQALRICGERQQEEQVSKKTYSSWELIQELWRHSRQGPRIERFCFWLCFFFSFCGFTPFLHFPLDCEWLACSDLPFSDCILCLSWDARVQGRNILATRRGWLEPGRSERSGGEAYRVVRRSTKAAGTGCDHEV